MGLGALFWSIVLNLFREGSGRGVGGGCRGLAI